MTMSKTNLFLPWLAAALVGLTATAVYAQSPDALSKASTWRPSGANDVKAEAWAWLEQNQADEPTLAKATEIWSALPEQPGGAQLLARLAGTFALVDRDVAELAQLCAGRKTELLLPSLPWLADPKTPPLVANNMRLLYGRWLVHESMFDEALEQLAELNSDDVVAPGLLLFYQSVTYHTLLDKETGLKAIERLLSGSEHSPRRYVAVARLMQQDLEALEDDSLDHIARRMSDIRRRLGLGRAGKKVRKVEDGVIESLDKLIKKLEEQQKQCQGGGAQDNIRSSSPAPDSMPIGGKGRGEVTKRRIGSESGWGDLPPKEREEALQQIGRDFPSHYRDVIEEYFRRLAGQENP